MLKLILCMSFALVLAVVVLHLRQQRLEIEHQANVLHDQIEARQARLWSQQLEIAVFTAPNAIAHTVQSDRLDMVSHAPAQAGEKNWSESPDGSDAE